VVNDVEIKAGDFTLWLWCDELDRGGAGRLAFVLQYWSLWGVLPKPEDVSVGMLPENLN
jgi:hypothetical protein